MKILQVALGRQEDIRQAFSTVGEVIYWDWSGQERVFNQTLLQKAEQHKPDLIWLQIQTPGIISVDCARKLSQIGKVVNWTGDVRNPLPRWFIDIGKVIHLTLFSNMTDVWEIERYGVKAGYLQIGFPTEIFTPQRVPAMASEIVFMGNLTAGFPLSKYRSEMVAYLRAVYGNKFTAYGSGFGEVITDQHREAAHYRGAKIGINLSHFKYERYSSDRIFRLMGAGCFCLSHYYPGIEKEFTIGEHLDTWNDFEELKRKIGFYLQHDELRERIARVGCEHVHKNHTWKNRIDQLMTML